jgi:hypothetical protein
MQNGDDNEDTGDYGYDLVHELVKDGVLPSPEHEHKAVYAPPEGTDPSQDYGYDLAHGS